MITQITELLQQITPQNADETELPTILEQLEQENPANLTERHLLVSEREYEQQLTSLIIGKQLSLTVVVNAAVTYGLLSSITSLSLSFNPFIFYMLTTGISLITSILVADSKKSIPFNSGLVIGKLAVNTAVNGSLISAMAGKVNDSKTVVESIQQEIERYENGYKPQQGIDFTLVGVICLAILGIIIIPKLFTRRLR